MIGGYVYILINPCMPGLVKIGHSTRPPEERARELSQVTGVPVPFAVAYEEEFGLYFREAEQEVHGRLEPHRYNQNREFVSLPLKEAIRVLAEVAHVFRQQEDAEQRRYQTSRENSPLCGTSSPGDEPPFRLVHRQAVSCSFCAATYTVTFRRYEDHSCCPSCHRIHKVDVKW